MRERGERRKKPRRVNELTQEEERKKEKARRVRVLLFDYLSWKTKKRGGRGERVGFTPISTQRVRVRYQCLGKRKEKKKGFVSNLLIKNGRGKGRYSTALTYDTVEIRKINRKKKGGSVFLFPHLPGREGREVAGQMWAKHRSHHNSHSEEARKKGKREARCVPSLLFIENKMKKGEEKRGRRKDLAQ